MEQHATLEEQQGVSSSAGRSRRLTAQVREALVGTLFASPLSLTIGAIAGTLISACVAYSMNDWRMTAVAIGIPLVGICRVYTANIFKARMHQGSDGPGPNWEIIYEIGAWSYAALLGLMVFLALTNSTSALPQLLAATMTTGYAAGISTRNAGRPVIAIGQLSLAALPMSIALFAMSNPLAWVLGGVNLLFVVSQTDLTMKTYKVIFNAFSSMQENAELAVKYERLASCDALTGLDNRTTLDRRLNSLLAQDDCDFAVIWIDLDRFKEVNDTLGHSVGDIVLRTTATRLREEVGDRGWIARFGGDEFVILYRIDRGFDIEAFGQRLLEVISLPIEVDGLATTVTASIGAALKPQDGTDDELLKHADMALYHAKKRGRTAFCAFQGSMQEELLSRREMEANLHLAIARDELEIFYQPVINLAEGTVTGCEALLRWNHPVHGPISPTEFIPLAEATGQISELTDFVLDRACTAAASWPGEHVVSVNISPILLRRQDFFGKIVAALYKSGLPAHRLELEITETVMVDDSPQANFMLKELRRIGLRLALDDFGTGFSSLSYLLTYSFDRIKIDRSFVMDLGRSREAGAITRSIVSLASALSIETVAEGVETEDQLEYVRETGCTSVQGFYFARPMSEDEAARYLASHGKKGAAAIGAGPAMRRRPAGFAPRRGAA